MQLEQGLSQPFDPEGWAQGTGELRLYVSYALRLSAWLSHRDPLLGLRLC